MNTEGRKVPSDGKTKALDLLDRHISQRSSLKKSVPSTGPPNLDLGDSLILKPEDTETVFQRSPTPKRSKLSSLVRPIAPVQLQKWNEDGRSPFSSPTRKGVSFSDRIESSPISQQMGSSPIKPSSMTKPPVKSILKNAPVDNFRSENTGRIRGSPKKPSHLSIDPFSPDFWIEGEIHNMLDSNNIAEFRKLVEGGISILNNNKMKDFEVYATFNNIMPHTVGSFINDSMHQKTDVIINNLEALMNISIQVLKNLQDSLLLGQKKDPFKSRCYVQVVRFLSSLFSNFRVIKHLDGNLVLQQHFKTVLGCMTEVLTHINTNKAMVIYPLTLLEDEKFGQLYLPESHLKILLDSVLEMKEIDSTNVQCERLAVLRQYLQKYNKIMSERLISWFPHEVMIKFVGEDKLASSKILASCNMIILELLRKCISNQKVRILINQIDQLDCRAVLEQSCRKGQQNMTSARSINLTIGEALCRKLRQMVTDRVDYKLAMDCWLGMCGLLFNSEENIKDLLNPIGQRWLSVNEACFESEDRNVKNIAIKNRRILNYMILTNMTPESTDKLINHLVPIVLKPFLIQNVAEYEATIKSAYNGLFYIIFCNCKDLSGLRFKFLNEVILKPLLKLIDSKGLIETLGHHTLQLLVKVLKPASDDEKQAQKIINGFQPLKVISAIGVEISDFESMPINLSVKNWDALVKIVDEIISWEVHDNHLWCTLLQCIIKRTPDSDDREVACRTNLRLCRKMLSHECFPRDSTLEPIIKCLAEKFGFHLFSSDSIFLKDIINMEDFSEQQQFQTFKNIFNQVKSSMNHLNLFGVFSSYDNKLISSYIANAVGSMLLPKNMSTSEYENFLAVVNRTPIPEVVDNLFTWLRKTNNWESIATKLNISSWDDDLFANFIPKWIHERKGIWSEETIDMISDSLWQRPRAFRQLAPFLIKCAQKEIIRNTLKKTPEIIDDLTLLGDLSLPEILPLPLILSSFNVIHKYDDVIKTHLFLCASIHKRIDLIKEHFNLLSDLLMLTDDDVALNNERNSIIDNVMAETIKLRDWELFNSFVDICLARKELYRIVSVFSERKYAEIIWSNCFATVFSKNDVLDSKLLPKFIESLKHEPSTSSLSILEHLLNAGKHQVFILHKDEIFKFFFDTKPVLSENDKKRIMLLFPKIVDYLMDSEPKLLIGILKYILRLMKETNDSLHGARLILCFLNHAKFDIQGNKRLMKKLNGYKGNLQRSERLQLNPSKDSKNCDGPVPLTGCTKIINVVTNISKNSDNKSAQKLEELNEETYQKSSSIIASSETHCHMAGSDSGPRTSSNGQEDLIENNATYYKSRLDVCVKKEDCIEPASTQSCTISSPYPKYNSVLESTSNSNTSCNILVDKISRGDRESSLSEERRFSGLHNNDYSKSSLGPSAPMKIPIFNPFAERLKIEDETQVSNNQKREDSGMANKRSFRIMSSEVENMSAVEKIRRVVKTLGSFTDEELSTISHEDRMALRNDVSQFMIRLKD